MVLLFLIGGGIFAIYPVAVSHAADRAQAESLVPMIQGLLLINSIGSAISPIAISGMMAKMGPNGLFWAFAGMHLALLAFLVWRRKERPEPVPVAPFAAAAQMSPTGVEMRVTEELVQGALDREAVEDAGRPAAS
jgi:MFS family permease